jgi:hypothetical protein
MHSHIQEKHMRKIILAVGLGATLSACGNWVNLTAAGRLVTVATPTEVTSCRRIGTSTANALSEIVFVERGSSKLQAELIDLARNEAADARREGDLDRERRVEPALAQVGGHEQGGQHDGQCRHQAE